MNEWPVKQAPCNKTHLLGPLKKVAGKPDHPCTSFGCRSLLADDLNDGVTGGDSGVGLDGKLDIGKLGGVGHGHHDAVLVTGSSDLGAVDLENGLAGLHDVVGLDETLEAVAVHVDGIDANVHQNLDAAIGLQTHGVTHGDGHLTVAGSVDQIVLGPHGTALAQNLATKDGIGHVSHLDDLALDGRAQHVGASRSRDGGRSSGSRGLSLLLEHVKQTHTFSPLD